MDWQKIKYVVFVGLAVFVSNCVSAIDVENYTIGPAGPECFRFAIFADPQVGEGAADISKLTEAVDKVIEINNDGDPANDVSFVMVLGDHVQGETRNDDTWKDENDYRQEYGQVKGQLERLKAPCPVGAGIHYIPVIGNHDVWFKFNDYTVVGGPPDYPEELFADFFGPQFDELSIDLAGWTKQEFMPSANPYNPAYPAPVFQNFAFDCGPYHFICLDFSARDDFDPIAVGIIPRLKRLTGCADLHDFTYGTWQWLNNHLSECAAAGIKNVIVFTHHPPIYQLELEAGNPPVITIPSPGFIPFASPAEIKGEAHIVFDPAGTLTGKTLSNYRTGPDFLSWDNQFIRDGTKADRMEGDVILGFNKQDYDGQAEYERFAPLFSTYGINIVHWFSGHYHLMGFDWTDNNINANVTAVPSIIPAERISRIEFDGSVRINEQAGAVVTPQDNLTGCVAIVRVNAVTRADFNGDCCVNFRDFAYVALQWLQSPGEPSADIAPPPDGDGIVNMQDLAVLVEHWLDGCEW